MNNSDLIEQTGIELSRVAELAHREGLNYWQILGEFLKKCDILYEQAEVEYWIKGGK